MIAIPIWALDFGAGDAGLVAGGATGQWEWGDPLVGPVGAPACWCTNCDGEYLHDTVDWLALPPQALTGLAHPSLRVRHWYAIRPGDAGTVELDTGTGFGPIAPVYGYPDPAGFVGESGGFVDAVFDLSAAGPSADLRLVLTADAALADAGWYVASIELWDGDIVPPSVRVDHPPSDTQDLDGPYVVAAEVADDVGATSVALHWVVDGVESVEPMAGAPAVGTIPAQPPGTEVGWWVEAEDAGENVGRWPASGEATFRVYLAAPTGLRADVPERGVAAVADLEWDPPVGPHPVSGYQVFREGVVLPVAVTATPSASVALAVDAPQVFQVAAVYGPGLGDRSDPLALDLEVPVLDPIEPGIGYQGDALTLELSGRSLYLLQDGVDITFTADGDPSDLTVTAIDVRDVSTAYVSVEIARDAPTGPVDVTLDGPVGRFVFASRFDVRDGADAPRIVSITPERLGQGESATVEIEASTPFAATPVVRVDDDLLVTGPVEWQGDTLTVPIAVGVGASPGSHPVSIDDGQRLYTTDLVIESRTSVVRDGCTHGPSGGWAWGVVVVLGRRRRW